MADKRIQDLTPATSVQTNDLFVLEQSGAAKSLSGQILINDLATALSGHGGIASITYTAPVAPSLDGTLTITMADTTTSTVTVTNGNGIDTIGVEYGISNDGTDPAYVQSWNNTPVAPTDQYPYGWTKISITDITGNTTNAYSITVKADDPTISIGTVAAASGTPAAASITNSGTAHDPVLNFSFTLPQGDKGDTGDYVEPIVSYGTSQAASTEPGTWYNDPSSISYAAGNYIWRKTEYTLHDAQTVQDTVKEIVGYIGQNGSGSGTVTQITFNGDVYTDDGTGNVTMTVDASDVGAIEDPSTKSNGQVLTYDSSAGEWVAANPSTGNVNTVNSKGVDAGTTNITLYASDIKMSSLDNTTIPNAIPSASSTTPADLGTAAVGTGTTWARADHVHKMPTASDVGALPSSTTIPSASSSTPADLGTAAVGTSSKYARADHVHNEPAYKVNNTYVGNIWLILNGIITNSSKELIFTVWLPKSLKNISTVSVTNMKGNLRNSSGGYVNSQSAQFDLVSSYTVSTQFKENYVTIKVDSNTAFTNVSNNSVVSFHGVVSLKFT